MTPVFFQDALVKETREILKDLRFKTPSGQKVPINVFSQDVPIPETDDEDDPVPYVILRLSNGRDEGGRDSEHKVRIIVIIGIWDDALDLQGYRDLLAVIDRFYKRFSKNPMLDKQYYFDGNFNWAVQEDNCYPYFFGACNLDFVIPAIRREDPYA